MHEVKLDQQSWNVKLDQQFGKLNSRQCSDLEVLLHNQIYDSPSRSTGTVTEKLLIAVADENLVSFANQAPKNPGGVTEKLKDLTLWEETLQDKAKSLAAARDEEQLVTKVNVFAGQQLVTKVNVFAEYFAKILEKKR